MKIETLKVLRGPNQWARFPVLEAWVDLGPLEDSPSDTIPGFNDRLIAWLPRMIEHRCSVGTRGGFFERLRRGTWMGHILEHVTLELQTLAGSPVGYGRARETSRKGVYRVAIEFREENFAIDCLHTAHRLLMAAIADEPFDVDAEVARLHEKLLEEQLGPSTRSIVEAATARGIPSTRLTEGSLVRLGYGVNQRKILTAETDATSAIGQTIAQDKELTRELLAQAGIPVPEGRPVADADDACRLAGRLDGPAVVKPRYGNHGRGVSVNLRDEQQLRAAYDLAREHGREVVVETHAPGDDHRLLVVGGRLVAAARRRPPCVTGDGVSRVRSLAEAVNADPRRVGHATSLSPIPLDEVAARTLAEQGLDFDSVPEAGRVVLLRRSANLSTGGTAEDVTNCVHPEVAARAVEAAKIVGLDIAGVDVVACEISRPLEEQGGAIIEVNAGPGLRMHLEPTEGEARDVGGAIVEMLYPDGRDGRIPLAAVTGTNGKTTVTRLLAHIVGGLGGTVGMTCTEGVWVGGRQIAHGDCSGPGSAARVLAHPEVTAAVLETARGGILRRGLAFDRSNVSVVTNIGPGDHLGSCDINTPEKLAWVKSTIVDVVATDGYAVFNAADPLVVDMKRFCRGSIAYFAIDPANDVLAAHLAEGGRAATIRDGSIVLLDGPRETRLATLERVPLVHRGHVKFQVENVLAAAAAAWCLGVPLELVRLGLESFSSGTSGSPGRLNLLEIDGAAVVVDYGHNVASLECICEVIEKLPRVRRTAVYSAAGDRRDQDLVAQGRLLGRTVDSVIIYEGSYMRGRAPGEIAGIIAGGIRETAPPREVAIYEGGGWEEAAERVFSQVTPGELIFLQPDLVECGMEWLKARFGERMREVVFDEMAAMLSAAAAAR